MEKKGLATRIALFHLLTIKNDPAAPVYSGMVLPAMCLFCSPIDKPGKTGEKARSSLWLAGDKEISPRII
jgi:hypothetical protein